MTKSEGFLYIATGEKYIREAEDSARSLKKVRPDPEISLVTDRPYESSVFSNVKVIEWDPLEGDPRNDAGQSKSGFAFKLEGLLASPYAKTIYVDTDMYFCEDVPELFELLDVFELLLCLDYFERSQIVLNGALINGCYPYQTGLIGFQRNERSRKLFEIWKSVYRSEPDYWWGDQPALMAALLRQDIRLHVLHSIYNFRFVTNVGFPQGEKVRLIHGRCAQKEFREVATRVNKTTENRVWVAVRRKCYSWTERNLIQRYARRAYSAARRTILGWARRLG